jgi:hypothetical protein
MGFQNNIGTQVDDVLHARAMIGCISKVKALFGSQR